MIKIYAPLNNITFDELSLQEILNDIDTLVIASWELSYVTVTEKGNVPGYGGGNPTEEVRVVIMRTRAARPESAAVPFGILGIVVNAT